MIIKNNKKILILVIIENKTFSIFKSRKRKKTYYQVLFT